MSKNYNSRKSPSQGILNNVLSPRDFKSIFSTNIKSSSNDAFTDRNIFSPKTSLRSKS